MSICSLIVTTFDSNLASYYSINSNNNIIIIIININEIKHTSTMHDDIQLRSRSNSTRNGCR